MIRLASLALAFSAGVLIAHCDGAATAAVALMWAAALVLGVVVLGGRGAALILVMVLAGAARMSVHELERAPALPVDAAPDDRVLDRVRGVVRGPVEEVYGGAYGEAYGDARGEARDRRRRFVVDADAPAHVKVVVSTDSGQSVLPGDRVEVWGRLRTPRGYRVPGAVDLGRIARAQGGELVMHARQVEVVEPGAAWSPWRLATRLHRWASTTIAAREGDGAGNAVVRAMVIGDRSGLDPPLVERFRDAGVSHVLAVSGLHLAVVAMFVFVIVRRVFAAIPALALRVEPALAAALIAGPGALVYAMMTGGRVSTLRALLVVAVVLLGAATARRARVIDALGFAALVLLVHRPSVLLDPSFQLSFSATATLALVLRMPDGDAARPLAGRRGPGSRILGLLGYLLDRIWDLLCAAFWAALATAPFAALSFGALPSGGLIGNLIAVPLTTLCIVPLGLLGCVLAAIWPAGGGVVLDVVIALAGLLDRVVAVVAAAAPVVRVFPPKGWELGGAALIWIGAVCAARSAGSRRVCTGLVAAGLAVVLVSYWVTARWAPSWRQEVRITFLDVGQGDAAVVELPGGVVWMIDGGGLPFVAGKLAPEERARRARGPGLHSVARFLAWRRIDRIDVLVLSHPHPDHYEGVAAVADVVDIGEIWLARGHERGPPSYQALLDQLAGAGARVVHPRLDRVHTQGEVAVTVLAPRYLDDVATADPVCGANDNSLVVRLDAYGRSVLFAGDLEREGEELLVARYGAALRADLVKVPHHGSPTSSTAEFVAATSPLGAIVSCGVANRFGFPSASVVERWQGAGARVFRTDQMGAVTATIAPDGALRVRGFDSR